MSSGALNTLGTTKVQLANVQGRVITLKSGKRTKTSNGYEYNLSNYSLSSGLYILSVQTDAGKYATKLIIR